MQKRLFGLDGLIMSFPVAIGMICSTGDTLCISHFAIDINNLEIQYRSSENNCDGIRILHAPNHKNIKKVNIFLKKP